MSQKRYRSINKITQENLKNIIKYDRDTGVFIWKSAVSNHISVGDIAGTVDKNGYIVLMIKGKNYLAHRLAFLYVAGYWPENEIDHINKIRDDNRWCNLREVSRSCNMRNSSIRKDNVSGVTGVSFDKKRKKWRVRITNNKKEIFIGYFKNLHDAVRARFEAEIKYDFQTCNNESTAYKYLKRENIV